MRILFIAPVPPPINGQSKASKVLLDKLIQNNYYVTVVNLSKNSLKSGFDSFGRFFNIILILRRIWLKRKNKDVIYLSLAESFLGNIRDLFIFCIFYNTKSKFFLHMLGGAGMKKILENNGPIKWINYFFIKNVSGIIVEGPVNFHIFSKILPKEKIHIVPNFAEDFLFVSDNEIKEKFHNASKLQILYLSNLIQGKGYVELAEAYFQLDEEYKKQLNIVFVGGFETNRSKTEFLNKIKNQSGLVYLGNFIDGDLKRKLYCNSHLFCLPSYYPFEGQPISILEAYAAGCVVIASNHSGIPFIFADEINGFMVEKKSVHSIKMAIYQIFEKRNSLEEIAFFNRNEALIKFRVSNYQESLINIFSYE